MAPQREIPGFYWDEEKGRYFKVESSKTAPAAAAWSSDSVKKRKLDVAATAEQSRRLALVKNRIKRSKALNHPLMGGFFVREYSECPRDINASAYTHGLTDRGTFRVWNHDVRSNMCIKDMIVTPGDTGNGPCSSVHYWESTCPGYVVSGLVPRSEETGRVHNSYQQPLLFRSPYISVQPRFQPVGLPTYTISDIQFSEKTDLILATAREGVHGCGLLAGFTRHPRVSPMNLRIRFTLDSSMLMWPDSTGQKVPAFRNLFGSAGVIYGANTVCAAPASSDYLCMVGTTLGLTLCTPQGDAHLTTPLSNVGSPSPWEFRDVFAVTLQASNPNNVYFGGRPGVLLSSDIRQKPSAWSRIDVAYPITHLKPVSEHQLLVSGLWNKLSVFDVRFSKALPAYSSSQVKYKPSSRNAHRAAPVISMPGYKNAAHIDIGLDYDKDTGTVAAAHDDGTIALYSVRSGLRLPCRDVDQIHQETGPICGVHYHTFVGDKMPSLFVGDNGAFRVLSFKGGMDDPDDDQV